MFLGRRRLFLRQMSSCWKVDLGKYSGGKAGSRRQRLSRWIVSRSGLFDANYYLQEYSDVAGVGMDPLFHYCQHGWRERRKPGPMAHPEYVYAGPIGRYFARINPLVTWSLLGRWLGWSLAWPQLRTWKPPTGKLHGDLAIFVHEATRTGAPIFALRLARWMRRKRGVDPILVVLDEGSLLPEMWNEFRCLPLFAVAEKARPGLLQTALGEDCTIYLNSLASLRAWAWLDWHKGALLLHAHESAAGLKDYAPWLAAIAPSQPRSIAVNESCRTPLAEMLGREPDIIPPAIDLSQARARSGVSLETRVIVGCGTMSRRKGADLFCQVAAQVLARFDGEVEFCWVGGEGDVDMRALLQQLGIAHKVRLAGEVPDPLQYLSASTLFLLPSRDDPFPLVALEAASCGLPVLCFDALADGVGAWVAQGAGQMVQAFDVAAMAAAVIDFLESPDSCATAGAVARNISARFDIEQVGEEIYNIIDEVVAEKYNIDEEEFDNNPSFEVAI